MQRLTEHPRGGLSEDAVRRLLIDSEVTISMGCELLDAQLRVTEDISDDFEGGELARNNEATIHGTCRLSLSRELTWGTDLVRPYMLLSNSTLTDVRFNLGVYALVTPERKYGNDPATFDCEGYDRLYLLDREVGDSYEVGAGTSYLTAVRQAITDAGLTGILLDGTAGEKTLPKAMVWPLVAANNEGTESMEPTTWLRVVNDLLAPIGYRGIWVDQDGRFRSEPYKAPAQRPVEFVLDEGANTTIQGEERTLTRDMWKTPNRWVFVATNPPEGTVPSVANGYVYIVDNLSDGPTSQEARGLVWARRYEYEVADPASLVTLGDRRVSLDKQITATWNITTSPLPIAGHFDVVTLDVEGSSRKVQAHEWRMPLDGSDMTWTFDEVVA
jgi:hypothetical protein